MMPSVPEDTPREGVGARLKRLRVERGFSQRDLSSPGVSYAYISRIEAGARTPSVKALRKLSQKLGVSVEYLETGRDIRDVDDRELRLTDAELELRLEDDTRGAEQKLEKLLDESRAAGDGASATRAAIGLGFAAAHRGNHLDAVERLETALAQAPPSPQMRPDVYSTLGQSYAALGAADRAARLFERCLDEVKETAPADLTIRVRYATLLSYALSDAGDYDRARSVVMDALQEAGSLGDPHSRIRLLWAVSRVAAIEGRSAEALQHIRKAMALLEATDDTLQLARGYLLAAGIESSEKRVDETRELLSAAERLLAPHAEARDVGMLRIGQSRLATLEGDGDRAVETARDALAIFGDSHGDEQGAACWALASGLMLKGDLETADTTYRRAIDLMTVHGRRHSAGQASVQWASHLQEQGRGDEAEPILRRAYDLGVDAETPARKS
jgi:tetratricopeptide (TPR) repeat protein/DNA-binding XRE family transcriptional regulator